MASFLFYIFSLMLIVSAVVSVSISVPVYSVLSLICAFVSVACLLFMIGAEYLGATTVIVYVGAVAVLFLFVVMMLDNDKNKDPKIKKNGYKLLVGLVVLYSLYAILMSIKSADVILPSSDYDGSVSENNVLGIGKILYTEYFLPFQISSFILLVAMIGAIVLTLRHKKNVKRQDVAEQIRRSDSVYLVNPKSGKGVKI